MKKIVVTGADGQLGTAICQLSAFFPEFKIIGVNRAALDITQSQRIIGLFRRESFDYCINAAAYTAVDKAESEVEQAYNVNVLGTSNIAETCALLQIPMVHISTDYVYDNQLCSPIQESMQVNPNGIYARTKYEGELAAKAAHNMVMVIRTAWVYGTHGHNFLKTMLKLGAEKDAIQVVFDQIGTPTYVVDLAVAILNILRKVEQNKVEKPLLFDTYHYSNEGVASWYDFAKFIFDTKQFSCKISPILSKNYPTPVQRPPYSVLDKAKIKTSFDIEIPHWMDAARRCLKLV